MKSTLQQTPIAIIGMAGIFPHAKNLREYWENIINKVNCITDVPPSRWHIEDYYDPDPSTPDKTYCKRGGFIPDIDFNPIEFGLPPNSLEVTDVSQLLSLVVAKQAMEDAGYGAENPYRQKTGVILGVGGGQKLITPLTSRLQYPIWKRVLKSSGISDEDSQKILEKMKLAYIPWEENSFPGMLGNVIAGRIANRLDLGGINCVVDAACAGSLAALRMTLSELTEYRSDMMITGGVDTDNSIFMYMSFSKTPAFSKQQNMKPFDADSDGMMIGEGVGMLVLKRLEDAQQDGDRIYAVIKGIGTSSDGKYKSIYAPRASGQSLALRRAYESAGFAASTVGMIEAHGTGTVAGDPTEFAALKATFSENNLKKQSIALGSVKSQIGHTKAAAGAASLIKTALALHHKILPPTINITQPNPQFEIEDSPFYLNTETRPWFRAEGEPPRRAGASSFGFGGTNYHVVLEEYQNKQTGAYRLHKISAPILLFAQTPTQLLAQCENLRMRLESDAAERHYAELIDSHHALKVPQASARVGFVAKSLGEACDLLQITIDLLTKRPTANSFEHPKGIHYRKRGFDTQRKVVALFAGQGSQYLEMGRQIALNFPPLRQAYAEMDTLLLKKGLSPISNIVFPCPVFDVAQKNAQVAALQQTENAQPAIGAFSIGLYKILQQAGFKPDFVAGHSFGELTALWAAEVFSDEDYFFLAQARGQAMAAPGDPNFEAGAMLAVTGDINDVHDIVEKFPNISVANWNSNIQVVLGGPTADIETIQQVFEKQHFSTVLLPVSAAFHTPLVEHAHKPFAQALNTVTFNRPKIPVYSNLTGMPYPDNPAQIRKMLASHTLKPVNFKRNIENLSAAGGYLFIEFGPRNILTALVSNLLEDKPHFAVALNASRKKDSDYQLRDAVIQLRVAGLPLHHLDPYSLKSPLFHSGGLKGKELTVRLNGANYVSEKTRAAFENALQSKAEALDSTNENQTMSKAKALDSTNENQTMTQSVENRQRVLEQIQTPLNSLQEESGHIVHQQYLKNMGEYSQQFFQLMQQQYALLTSGNCTPAMLESFERSLRYFHEHQAQMQRVHEQYLKNQVEYSQTVLQLMPHSQLATGDATAQAPMPMLPKATAENAPVESALPEVSPMPTVNESAPSAVSPTPTVKESAAPAVSPTPTVKESAAPAVSPTLTVKESAAPAVYPTLTVKESAAPAVYPTPPTTSIPVASNRATPIAEPEPVSVPVSVPEPVSSNDSSLLQDETTVVEETKSESVATPAIDLASLTQSMLNIVSDKTGYPADMLEVEMDMEADLGIDSIKRVEILGAMQEQFPDLPPVNPEELTELRTLAEIVEYMGGAEKKKAPRLDDDEQPLVHTIQQHQVKLKPLPAPDCLDLSWASSDHICLLTDDGTPTTIALAKGLTERGFLVVMLSFPDVAERSALPTRVNRVVLTDLSEAHLKQQLAAIADNYGPIGAFVHLNPLSQDVNENILGDYSEKSLLKSVFLIAKHLKRSLNEAAQLGRSFFVTVTRLDGELGLGQHSVFQRNQAVISGGLFGLTKTLNLEWQRVFCRAIDLSPDLEAEKAAQLIIAELYDPNLLITEVGYNPQQERTTLVGDDRRKAIAPTEKGNRLNADSVFLVSGGGRGITAQCVIRLAKAFQCQFILLGRTKRTAEPAYAQGCVDETELKQRLIKNLQAQAEKPTPVKVQKRLKAILAQREIDETLQAIERVGGQAEYLSVDITDAVALQEKLIASRLQRGVLKDFGAITGIIHGAGVLADKLIDKKTAQDFESVYSTKINGLQSMLACVNDNQLDHLVLFSSAAGFYGNIGQSDYAIANEILNKFAHHFKHQHPACHVVTFNWGPWDGGMVTAELKQQFAQRNIEVIPIEVGTHMLVDDFRTAEQETVQVLVGSPLVTPSAELGPELQTYRLRRQLSLQANPFLQDHVIGDYAVLPTTCASAWLANTAQQRYPGYQFFSCENYKVLKGIVFDETLATEYIIDLKETDKSKVDHIKLAATIWSETATGKPRYHYTNQITLVRQIPSAPHDEVYDNTPDEALVKLSPYQDGTLFHGPRFQGIKRILNISPEKLTMECVLPQLDDKQLGQFPALAFNPIAADVQFQCLLIWVRHFYQAASLPLRCLRGEHFQAIPEGETFYVSMEVQSSTNTKLVANITSHNNQGQVYSRVFDAEVTISKQLNHLFVPSSVPDPARFLPYWREFLEVGEWPGEVLFTALFQRFVGRVVYEDSAEFNSLTGKPVLYLANHQVGVESILFGFSLSALAGCPINVVVKAEHRESWISQLLTHLYSYPTLKNPELMFYFDRDSQSSMLELLSKFKKAMIEQRRSLLIHVEGTRALSCRQPVKRLSAVFIDLAIELDIPIVPVGFVGGLPIEPLETRLEFPVGYTRQNYHLGQAIYPEVLKKRPNAERKTLILERLNQLAETTNSFPHAPDHHFEQAVHMWKKQTGVSEVQAVLYKVLEEVSAPNSEIRALLRGIQDSKL